MLKVETEILEDRQAKLVVTVEPERVEKELRAAARRIAGKVDIPGFRKGKAPYHIIVRHLGEDLIFDETLESLGQAVYREALAQSDLEPYAAGTLDHWQREPSVMSFTIPLQPEVSLGDYRDLRVPFEVPEITNQEVEDALENLRVDQATLLPTERPVQIGDVATLDFEGNVVEVDVKDDQKLIKRKGARILIDKTARYPVPGFVEQIVGMAAGDKRNFDISLLDSEIDLGDVLRGKTVHFEVFCREVYQCELPDLNDEFAQSVGEYGTFLDLRADIRKRLEKTAESNASDQYIEKIFEHLMGGIADVHYPPIMLEEQLDGMLEEFGARLHNRLGITLDDYLRINNLEKEVLREEFRESAERTLVRSLIVERLSVVEKINVKDEEVEDYIQTQLLSFGSEAPAMRVALSSPMGRKAASNHLLVKKTIERLVQIAHGEAPDLSTLEDEVKTAAAVASDNTVEVTFSVKNNQSTGEEEAKKGDAFPDAKEECTA